MGSLGYIRLLGSTLSLGVWGVKGVGFFGCLRFRV